MGQYYTVLLKKGNKRETFKAKGHLKLMEHAYLTNPFTDYIFNMLYEYGPFRVAWLGDYAHNNDDAFGGLTHEQYMKEYNAVYRKEAKKIDLWEEDDIKLPNEKLMNMSLVNHTKKIVLHFSDYISNSKKLSELVINPLAILTACGNGRGGGDYSGRDMNFVGKWAFDKIEIMDKDDVPKDYKSKNVLFIENRS